MCGSSFLPPYAGGGGAAPPWGAAPAIGGLGASHIDGAGGVALVSGVEAGRQWPWPLGLWSASGGFVGVVVGRAQYVQAECYRGVRSRHTAVWRGAVHLRVRMYVGHDVLGTSITSYTLSRVTQSTARTVEVSELPAAARVVAAVGVVI